MINRLVFVAKGRFLHLSAHHLPWMVWSAGIGHRTVYFARCCVQFGHLPSMYAPPCRHICNALKVKSTSFQFSSADSVTCPSCGTYLLRCTVTALLTFEACAAMSRLVLAACVGAAAYVLLRPPRDDPLDDFEYAAPSARAAPPPAPPPVAAKPPEPAPVPALPVQSRNPAEPIDALLLGILRFVGVQIFISVLVVLAVSLFLGAENGRTVGIGAFGIFSVFTFSALAQMRLQVGVADARGCRGEDAVHGLPFCMLSGDHLWSPLPSQLAWDGCAT